MRLIIVIFAFLISLNSMATQPNKTVQSLEKEYTQEMAIKAVNSIKRHQKFEEAQLNHRLFAMKHKQDSLQLQYIQSCVIFIVVMLLVIGGFYLAYLQFKLDEQATKKSLAMEKRTSEPKDTTLEITKNGLKISSSVIGLIVLAMSFAFFFLYIEHVYTITEISTEATPSR